MDHMDLAEAFAIEEVQLQFQLQSNINKLLVRNNHVYLILSNGTIHRIDLDEPEVVTVINIPLSRDCKLVNAWIDIYSYHLILQTSNLEYYYVNQRQKTAKYLSKLKHLPLNCVAFFDECVTSSYTGPLLLSTNNSLVLEYAIDSGKEGFLKTIIKKKDCFVKIVNGLLSNKNGVLTYLVHFVSKEQQIQTCQIKIPMEPAKGISVFTSLSKFDATTVKFNNLKDVSTHGGNLIYVESDQYKSKLTITQGQNSSTQKSSHTIELNSCQIKSYLVSKYYVIILTSDNTLQVYDQFAYNEISTVPLEKTAMRGLSYDALSGTYWIYSDKNIYEILIDNDKTRILDIMLDHQLFDESLKLLSKPLTEKDEMKYNMIMRRKGYYLLEKGDYLEAVEALSKSDESFEKVALSLFDLKDRNVLRHYLTLKLDKLPSSMHAQSNVISSWIVESFIEELNLLDTSIVSSQKPSKSSITVEKLKMENQEDGEIDEVDSANQLITDQLQQLTTVFRKFLSSHLKTFDKETVYQIMISHNRNDDLIYFANLMKDFEFVLKYYINLQKWDDSLNILVMRQDPELVYKSATVLMINHPSKTVDIWIRLLDDLNTSKLIPALLTYNTNVAFASNIKPDFNQALRFLGHLIYEKRSKNKIVHNTFFSILITYPNISDERNILKHLAASSNKYSKGETYFDYDFILRLCFKFHKIESAIYLYSILNRYDEAVKLALDNDLIEVAILVADKPAQSNDELNRKKLWLKISERLINKVITNKEFIRQNHQIFTNGAFLGTEGNDQQPEDSEKTNDNQIYLLLKFLTNKCHELSIKDLLPLFPDFVVIDNFKEALVESLEKLSLDMKKSAAEMDLTLKESEKINNDISTFKETKFQIIEPFESCKICNKILAVRKFIVFPCQHAFHQDCLVRQILNSNDYKLKNAIYKLQKKIQLNSKNADAINELKLEIDRLLTKSCYLCSDMKINEIDDPLIKSGDKELESWSI